MGRRKTYKYLVEIQVLLCLKFNKNIYYLHLVFSPVLKYSKFNIVPRKPWSSVLPV